MGTDLERRRPAGIALLVLGALVVLWAVLSVANAGYGTDPHRQFAERRSYNMVKRDVHSALPWALGKALAGFGLILVGRRLMRDSRAP